MSSLIAVYEAVAAQCQTHYEAMINMAGTVITFVDENLNKQQADLKKIHYDVQEYLIASLGFQTNSDAICAQWSEQKNIDDAKKNTDSTQMNTVMGTLKAGVQMLAMGLAKVVQMVETPNQCSKALIGILQRSY